MAALELLLHEIVVRLDPAAGQAAIEGGASLIEAGSEPPANPSDAPGFAVGIGTPEPMPADIGELFDPLFAAPLDDPGMWISSTITIPDTAGVPRWHALLTAEGVDLWGVDSIGGLGFTVPGIMTLDDPEVRVALQLRGAVITGALFELSGGVTLQTDLAGLGLSAGGEATWRFRFDVAEVSAIDDLLDDPARILETPVSGELSLELRDQTVSLPGITLPATDVFINTEAASNGSGQLSLDQLHYRQRTLGSVTVGPLTLSDSAFEATMQGWTAEGIEGIDLIGQAAVTLPPALDQAGTGTAFTTAAKLRRDADGAMRVEVSAERISIEPDLNLLELTAAELQLIATLDGTDWTLRLRGAAIQSWTRLARRLRSAGLRLHTFAGFPDLAATMELSISSGEGFTGAFSLDLTLVEPGSTLDESAPYQGSLGFLPLEVSGVELHLTASVVSGGLQSWQASGQGTMSSGPGLEGIAPFSGLAIEASIGVSVEDDPSAVGEGSDDIDVELALRISNLPPIVVPALDPAAPPIELLAVDEMQIWLSDRLEITSAVTLLPDLDGNQLAADLGAPGWGRFVGELTTGVSGLGGWFRLVIPLDDGPVETEVELRPATPPVIDLVEVINDVAMGVGAVLDVEVPEDGQQLEGSFAVIEPRAIRFLARFGAETSLALSAEALCTLLSEEFDLVLSLALVDGVPEMSLLAGVDDPVRVALSAGQLLDTAAAVDIDQMLVDFGVPGDRWAEVGASLAATQGTLTTFFNAPGMELDLAFEIRNLGVTFRPTDGDRMLQAGGTIRLTQLPPWLEQVLPGGGPSAVITTSVSSIGLSLQMPTAAEGSTRVEPLFEYDIADLIGSNKPEVLSFTLRSLLIEYSWGSNSVRVGWSIELDLPDAFTDDLVETTGSGIALQGPLASSGRVGAMVNSPFLPTVEWSFTAGDATGRGLELVAGVPGQRFVTLFSRQFSLFPTYMYAQPALVIDGGVIIGTPPTRPSSTAAYEYEADEFVLMAEIEGGVLQITPVPLGVIMNPSAVIAPFVSPQPPYWFPPLGYMYMLDVYGTMNLIVNVPGVISFSARLDRPTPELGLPAMIELALLAASGFDVEQIPNESAVRDICYVTLDIEAGLPLFELFGGATTPELALSVEANVADLMELAMHVGRGVVDGIGEGSDLVGSLLSDPDRLVAAMPPAARRFEGTMEIVPGLELSGSLHLLTSEELLDEVVLFHENRRRKRRGVAALDDPCTAVLGHHGPPVMTTADMVATATSSWTSYQDPRRATPTVRAWTAANDESLARLSKNLRRHQAQVDTMLGWIAKLDESLIGAVIDRIEKAGDPREYVKALELHTPPAAKLAEVLSRALDEVGPPPSRGRARGGWDRKLHNAVLRLLPDTERIWTTGEADSTALAKKLASLVFLARRISRSRVEVEVLPFSKWPSAYRAVVGAPLVSGSSTEAKLAGAWEKLVSALGGRKILTIEEHLMVHKTLLDGIRSALDGVVRGDLISTTKALDVLADHSIMQRFDAHWTWDDRTEQRQTTVLFYDGLLVAEGIGSGLDAANEPTSGRAGVKMVDRPVGWQVVVNDGLDPPVDVELSPPIVLDSPRADLAVRFRGGRYEIVVRDHDGTDLAASPVPEQLLTHPEAQPPDPGRLDRLRAMIGIEQRIESLIERWPAEEWCEAPHLYQDSLFTAPEYRIDPTGDGDLVGVRGPLTLADLLRNQATGVYVDAPGPVAVAGMVATLDLPVGTAAVRLTGLVAPEITVAPGGGPPTVTGSAFLEGFSSFVVEIGSVVLALEGSFTLVTGDLWTSVAPGVPAGDSLRFDGSITASRPSGAAIFSGQAGGVVSNDNGQIGLELEVAVEIDIDIEIDTASSELARVWTCDSSNDPAPATLDLTLSFSGGDLAITANGKTRLCLALALLQLEEVEIFPETTLCLLVPKIKNGLPEFELVNGFPVPVLVESCTTIPAETCLVPTIGELGPPIVIEVQLAVDIAADPVATFTIGASQTGLPVPLVIELSSLIPGA